jgi:predicted nucleotidyltransferase
MRLTDSQVDQIRKLVKTQLPDHIDYDLRLFGSRTNDDAKGGDVDLYLEVDGLTPEECVKLKFRLHGELEEALDLPVDLVIQDRSWPLKLVSKIARREGIPL